MNSSYVTRFSSLSLPLIPTLRDSGDTSFLDSKKQLQAQLAREARLNAALKQGLLEQQEVKCQAQSVAKSTINPCLQRLDTNCQKNLLALQAKYINRLQIEIEQLLSQKKRLQSQPSVAEQLQLQILRSQTKKLVSSLQNSRAAIEPESRLVKLSIQYQEQEDLLHKLQSERHRAERRLAQAKASSKPQEQIAMSKKRTKLLYSQSQKKQRNPIYINLRGMRSKDGEQCQKQLAVVNRERRRVEELLESARKRVAQTVQPKWLFFNLRGEFVREFGYDPTLEIDRSAHPDCQLQLKGQNLLDRKWHISKRLDERLIRRLKREFNLKVSLYGLEPKRVADQMFSGLTEGITYPDLLRAFERGVLSLGRKEAEVICQYLLNDIFEIVDELTTFGLAVLRSSIIHLMGTPLPLSEAEEEQYVDSIIDALLKYGTFIEANYNELGRSVLTEAEVLRCFRLVPVSSRDLQYLVMVLFGQEQGYGAFRFELVLSLFRPGNKQALLQWRRAFARNPPVF